MYNQFQPYGNPQYGHQPMTIPQSAYMQPQSAAHAMEVVPVQTIQQVEQVGLQPGQRKMVMVQNDAVVALRVADPVSGIVDTKYYNLVEFDPRMMQAQPANYVTAEQLEARLSALVDSLRSSSKPKKDAKEAAE